jgi:hypothetical protein
MFSYTDPTYLRTIYDGLNSGALNKDNASALPMGLVGMYEAEIPPVSNVNNRKRFLDFFAVWALLKKEVSLEFILPLLEGLTEVQLLDYMAKYSKWFNSPVSGKFQIYHERFRTFIYQKISNKQFTVFNDLIINQCKEAIQKKNGDEWERYALEHLSKHMLIPAFEYGNSDVLKRVAYDNKHWNRQIEISKDFEWSRQLLNDMMLWASKYNDEEVIECALNKVDLHYQEQNDAPRIVELVANNDIETALQRIESFGGNNKEGLQRKFILYMICLLELTLLESKDKPFSNDAIEKLLKHLDDNLPVDHSLLNWDDFFPKCIIDKLIKLLLNIGFVPLVLQKYTKLKLNFEIITVIRNSNLNINIISTHKYRKDTSINFLKIQETNFSLMNLEEVNFQFEENAVNKFKIALDLLSVDNLEDASKYINEGVYYCDKIPEDDMWISYGDHLKANFIEDLLKFGFHKIAIQIYSVMKRNVGWDDSALENITDKLHDKGDLSNLELLYNVSEKKIVVLNSLLECYLSINKNNEIIKVLFTHLKFNFDLINVFNQLGFFNKVIHLKPKIDTFVFFEKSVINYRDENNILLINKIIENYLTKETAFSLGNQLINVISLITDDYLKANLVKKFVKEIFQIDGGVNYIIKNGIFREEGNLESFFEDIFFSLCNICDFNTVVILLGQLNTKVNARVLEDATKGILKAYVEHYSTLKHIDELDLFINSLIPENYDRRNEMLFNFSEILISNSLFIEAKKILFQLDNSLIKCNLILKIVTGLLLKNNNSHARSLLHECIDNSQKIIDDTERFNCFIHIVDKLVFIGQLELAMELSLKITDQSLRFKAIKFICLEQFRIGLVNDSLLSIRYIKDEVLRVPLLNYITSELMLQLKFEHALLIIRETISIIHLMDNELEKIKEFSNISTDLSKLGRHDEASSLIKMALLCLDKISSSFQKNSALEYISIQLVKQNRSKEIFLIINNISDENIKSNIYKEISLEFLRQEKMLDSLVFLNLISNNRDRFFVIEFTINMLFKNKEIDKVVDFGLKILNVSNQNKYWEIFSNLLISINEFDENFIIVCKFNNKRLKKIFLNIWIENSKIERVNTKLASKLILYSIDDINNKICVLQYFIIRKLFFESYEFEVINRFNKIINIEWAIDLKKIINYE